MFDNFPYTDHDEPDGTVCSPMKLSLVHLLEDSESHQETELVTQFKRVHLISALGPFVLLRGIYVSCAH
jgi:hypothetical protein